MLVHGVIAELELSWDSLATFCLTNIFSNTKRKWKKTGRRRGRKLEGDNPESPISAQKSEAKLTDFSPGKEVAFPHSFKRIGKSSVFPAPSFNLFFLSGPAEKKGTEEEELQKIYVCMGKKARGSESEKSRLAAVVTQVKFSFPQTDTEY